MYGWDWMDGSSSGDKKCSEYFVVVKIRFFFILLVGFNEMMILGERGIGLLLKLTAGRFMNRSVLDLREKANSRMEYRGQNMIQYQCSTMERLPHIWPNSAPDLPRATLIVARAHNLS